MIDNMMGGGMGGWGYGILGALILLALILGVVALIRYIFSGG